MATVLIADDSPTLRRIVSTVLTRAGHEVIEAHDGVQAVQAAFRYQPDAVVLDVQMPRVSGWVAARLLKDDWRTSSIPVVLLTSLDAASDRYWGAQAGVDRYLTKDFRAEELAEAVASVLAARPPRPGALRPDPEVLDADDVLTSVCELLDRKLFEASVAGEVVALAASARGLEHVVAGLLGLLSRVVDFEVATVLLAAERTAYVGVARPASQEQYTALLAAAAHAADAAGAEVGDPGRLVVRLADPQGLLVADPDDLPDARSAMATFASMPLRGAGGRLLGVLALSSSRTEAFGETALSTLRLLEAPASLVLDTVRLSREPAGLPG